MNTIYYSILTILLTFILGSPCYANDYMLLSKDKKLILPNSIEFELSKFQYQAMESVGGPVALSASGKNHVSSGSLSFLEFDTTYTNISTIFFRSIFIAPRDGLYLFTISFVKDSYFNNGTTEDVSIKLFHNSNYIGQALSGSGSGSTGTGTYTVIVNLNFADSVIALVDSKDGKNRHLLEYNLSALLIE